MIPLGVPTGPLRAPGDNALAFVFQSFIDELAHAAGKDSLQFQIDLLGKDELFPGRGPGFNTARARGVLEKVREVSSWGQRKLAERTGQGVAFYYSHLGYFAEVVEAAVATDGNVKINKVWAVGDIGGQVIRSHAGARSVQSRHQRPNPGTAIAPPRSATQKWSLRSPLGRLITENPPNWGILLRHIWVNLKRH